MCKVVIYTQAYNAEKTLRRSVDSVLNQSFRDFAYYVADNCSTDNTRSIIQEYASKDRRVRPIYYDVETGGAILPVLRSIRQIRETESFEWLCFLDADDIYAPAFLQEMLDFSLREHLDMAVCSSRFIQAETGQQIGARAIPQEVVISGATWGTYFPVYHQFMRAWWAKLIYRDAVEKADLAQIEKNTSVGGDTMLVFEFLRHCLRVGLSPKLLHDYSVSPASGSYRFTPDRIGADAVQHYATVGFLKEKVGEVSQQNAGFLYLVYFNAVVDTVNVLLHASNVTVKEKLSDLRQLLSIDATLEMLGADAVEIEKRRSLIEQLLAYINNLGKDLGGYEDAIWLGLTLSSLVGDQKEYIKFSKLQIQYLLANQRWVEAQAQLTEWGSILPDDPDLARYQRQIGEEKNGDGCTKLAKTPSDYGGVQDMHAKYSVNKQENSMMAETHTSVQSKSHAPIGCDTEFYALIKSLKNDSVNQLLSNAAAWANKWIEEDHEYYGLLLKYYRSWYGVGHFGQDQGFTNYFGGIYQYLKQNSDEIAWLYEELADYRSKLTLKIMLQHWMTFHPDLRELGRECLFEHYFDLDVIQCSEQEVFADCGCFDGGTVKEFIKTYGPNYKSIYSYEPTPSTYELAKENLKAVPRLYLRNAGVSDKNGQLTFWTGPEGTSQGANRLNPNGNTVIKVVKLDDDIQEAATFIKMDIEGAEVEALRGAEQQIRCNRPKLAISLYHKLSDLIEIPRLIKSYVPQYKLYLRHYFEGKNEFPFPTEYVLLCVTDDGASTAKSRGQTPGTKKPSDPAEPIGVAHNKKIGTARKLILCGLTQYAHAAIPRLHAPDENLEIVSVCDLSGQYCGKNLKIEKKRFPTFPIIDFAQMVNICRSGAGSISVLLTEDPFRWNAILEQLRKAGVDNVFAVPNYVYWDANCHFPEFMHKVPMERPMLTYYEYHTAEHCNLNCFHCGNFSNVLSEPQMGNLEQYKKDVNRLKELFWNVGKLRFQGGEPLLNPDLPEFIRVTREAFPIADIGVLSNGLLIPKAAPKLFEAMRKYHVTFWISGYPPTYKMKDKILKRCSKEGIPVSIMPLIKEWRMESIDALGSPPSTDWAEAEKWWRQCGARDSHLLKDGYLYYCCFTSPLIPDLYKRLNLDIKDNHMWQHLDELRFDLSDPELDGWKISQKLDHVHECCLYCVNRWPNFKSVPWKTCPSSQIKAEDYMWNPHL